MYVDTQWTNYRYQLLTPLHINCRQCLLYTNIIQKHKNEVLHEEDELFVISSLLILQ